MKEARLRCFDYTKAFGECAKVNGLMVVFKCREENRLSKLKITTDICFYFYILVNECLNKYCTEAEFEKHMKSLGY